MSKSPARIRTGDRVTVKGWSPVQMEVVNTSDPSSLTVTTPSGATLKVGGQAVVLADLHTLVQQEAGNGA